MRPAQRRNQLFRHLRKRNAAALVAILVAGIAGASAYAFTASNTVPDHTAGAGQAQVSGYTFSNFSYEYSGDGTEVDQVSFDTGASDAEPNSVKVALTDTDTPVTADWVTCGSITGTGPYTVTCTFGTPIDVGHDNFLSIAADSSGTVTIGS